MPETDISSLDANLLDLLLRGGSHWVLWVLISLSVLAMAVILERLWFYAREQRPRRRLDDALAALRRDGAPAAQAALAGARSMDAAVGRVCLGHAGEGAEAVAEHLTATVESERLRYERGLAFLGTLGANAPFVGLFGTVLGIIRAFHDLAASTAQGAQAVMGGVAQALVATAVGLIVALPAVAAYNTFARHVEARAVAAGAFGRTILAHLRAEESR